MFGFTGAKCDVKPKCQFEDDRALFRDEKGQSSLMHFHRVCFMFQVCFMKPNYPSPAKITRGCGNTKRNVAAQPNPCNSNGLT